MNPLVISTIRTTSPTLAETMRICSLRAGLSKAAGSSGFVLGSPAAWLGTAYHEVLEKIGEACICPDDAETTIELLWSQAVATQQRRVETHALNHRFGPPPTWPGYHVTRASVALRARELVARPTPMAGVSSSPASEPGKAASVRERQFTAFGGRLSGRPDVIRNEEILDYKSGAIVEHDEDLQADVVKNAYVRQLRIYGFLVKETLGWWPKRGQLLPIAGDGIEVALTPLDCSLEATDAVTLLDAYNGKIQAGVSRKSSRRLHCRAAAGAHTSSFVRPFGAPHCQNGRGSLMVRRKES